MFVRNIRWLKIAVGDVWIRKEPFKYVWHNLVSKDCRIHESTPQPQGMNTVKRNSERRIPRKRCENRDFVREQIWSSDRRHIWIHMNVIDVHVIFIGIICQDMAFIYHMWGMTHSHESICETWLIHMWDVTHSYLRLCTCMRWKISHIIMWYFCKCHTWDIM